MTSSRVAILDIPGALKSAVYGLEELLSLSDQIETEKDPSPGFVTSILQIPEGHLGDADRFDFIIIPPARNFGLLQSHLPMISRWVLEHYRNGSIVASACAGTFVLAEAGLLDGLRVTTHWGLSETLQKRYPNVKVSGEDILIDEGRIITAGGLMSWTDLGLHIVERCAGAEKMHVLGRHLVLDTGHREQKYYASFTPNLNHTDDRVRRVQQDLATSYKDKQSIEKMALLAGLGERTFLRRFTAMTGHTPTAYIQKLRIKEACSLLMNRKVGSTELAYLVGYEDVSAFRRVFAKHIGLTPKAFRDRFVR